MAKANFEWLSHHLRGRDEENHRTGGLCADIGTKNIPTVNLAILFARS